MRRREFLSLCGLAAGSCLIPQAVARATYVEAPDLATLACLQTRLNELGEDLAIEIREW